MKCLGLVIIGIALRQLLHRLVVGGEPDIDRSFVEVAVVDAQSLDPIALALGLGAYLARLFERRPGGRRVRPRRRGDERVVEQVERDAPIGDRACGILLQDALKRMACDQEPEGMEHGDAALEFGLHLRIAGRGEAQPAQSRVLLGERVAARRNHHDACQDHRAFRFHGGPPCWRMRSRMSVSPGRLDNVRVGVNVPLGRVGRGVKSALNPGGLVARWPGRERREILYAIASSGRTGFEFGR